MRRIVSVTLLIVMVAGMCGLPLHAPSRDKQGRFPCEDCPCGCATADYCWDKCCCHSDSEKLRWARDNGVRPPDFLVARASCSSKNTVASCCCAAKVSLAKRPEAQSELDPKPGLDTAPGSEQSIASQPRAPKAASAKESGSPVNRIVLLEDAAKCRGISWSWLTMGTAIVPSIGTDLILRVPFFLYRMNLQNDHASSTADPPEPPVP